MKVRWTRNSIRLRITPGELETIRAKKKVIETFSLPGGRWEASVVPVAAASKLALKAGKLTFSLSAADRKKLLAADAEGVYFRRKGDPEIIYFIEKDFPCAHPRADGAAEPQTETFAPPAGFEARKKKPPTSAGPS